MCLEIYELDQSRLLLAPRLTWSVALKMTKVELESLNDTDKLLIVEKGIRSGLWHSFNRHAKVNNKYTKDYDKNKGFLYLKYWDVNNLYLIKYSNLAMSLKLPVNKFKCV